MRDGEKSGELGEEATRGEIPLRPEEGLDGACDEIPHSPKDGGCEPPRAEGGPPEDWEESAELGVSKASVMEMASYEAMVRRVEWMIVVAGAVAAAAVAWPLGWVVAVCLLVGAALAWINFRWLAASVNAIGERIVEHKSEERGAAVVARGVGRIILIALFACVIFTWSERGLVGFLAGFAMPVFAMMCEAVYEFAASSRRPS